jgi:hypothetical protein
MRRVLAFAGGVAALLSGGAAITLYPYVAMVLAPWPPGCYDGPCGWTEADGPAPLLAQDVFWQVSAGCVATLLLLAGSYALVRARPIAGARTIVRAIGSLARELVSRRVVDSVSPTVPRRLAATYWLAVVFCASAALAGLVPAAELQVRIYVPALVVLAGLGSLAATGLAIGVRRNAPERRLLAAWALTVLVTAAIWHVLDGLASPGGELAPVAGVFALAGHVAGLGAIQLGRAR